MTLLESFIALDTLNLLALLGVVFIGLPTVPWTVHWPFTLAGWADLPGRLFLFSLCWSGRFGGAVLGHCTSVKFHCLPRHQHLSFWSAVMPLQASSAGALWKASLVAVWSLAVSASFIVPKRTTSF